MRLAAEIVADIMAAGWQIKLGALNAPKLVPVADGATLDPALLAELKACRGNVVWWLRKQMADELECELCGRDLSDPEDRERMKDPAFCERGGAPEVKNRQREVVSAAVPRCPFKGNEREER